MPSTTMEVRKALYKEWVFCVNVNVETQTTQRQEVFHCYCDFIFHILHSLNCLGQNTAKRPFGFRFKLPPAYHTGWRLRTVRFNAELQAGKL